jgi:hypothetical protein
MQRPARALLYPRHSRCLNIRATTGLLTQPPRASLRSQVLEGRLAAAGGPPLTLIGRHEAKMRLVTGGVERVRPYVRTSYDPRTALNAHPPGLPSRPSAFVHMHSRHLRAAPTSLAYRSLDT